LAAGRKDEALVAAPIETDAGFGAKLVKLLALDGVGLGSCAGGDGAEAAAALPLAKAGVVDCPKATHKCAAREIAFPNERGSPPV
jgi:hypothetical protein